jgi:hypothetical protein
MNQSFYESRGKEKIRDLMEEGMRSQAAHRSGKSKDFLHRWPKVLLLLLGIVGILELLWH